jgi:hypothetical protein
LPEAIPRYSAVTSRVNLPAGVDTSVSFFWDWAGRLAQRRSARSPGPRVLERLFMLSSEPRMHPRTFPILPVIPSRFSLVILSEAKDLLSSVKAGQPMAHLERADPSSLRSSG